jgi:hypothetical protein
MPDGRPLLRRLSRLVVRVSALPGGDRVTRAPYDLCLTLLGRGALRVPGVRAVYVQRDYRRGQWVPGSSDIDPCVVLEPQPPEERERTLARLWGLLRALRSAFPFLSARYASVPVYDSEDLGRPGFGWLGVALHERAPPERWTLVAGEDARGSIRAWEPGEPEGLPLSPELCGLVDKHLHAPLLAGRSPASFDPGSLRRLGLKLARVSAARLEGRLIDDDADLLEALKAAGLDPDGRLASALRPFQRRGPCERSELVDLAGALMALRERADRARIGGEEPRIQLTPHPDAPSVTGAEALLARLHRTVPSLRLALLLPRGRSATRRPDVAPELHLVLGSQEPAAHAGAIQALFEQLRAWRGRPLGVRLHGEAGWALFGHHAASHYVLTPQHMARSARWVGEGGPVLPDPALQHLALVRRLMVERCHLLRSDLRGAWQGRPWAWCQNMLWGLLSYRCWLETGHARTLEEELADEPREAALRLLLEQAGDAPARRDQVEAFGREARRLVETCLEHAALTETWASLEPPAG